MSLSTTIEQLKKTLHRSDRTYAEARARHPALALYASPSAVLAAVGKGSPLSLRERDVLLLAILDERRRAPHPLWQSLLVVAFAPMLVRFRKAVKTAAAEVVGIVEAAGGEELRDALIARHAGDRSLKEYVAAEYPELTLHQRARICDRLRRTQASVLRKVRARLKRREWRAGSAA